MSKRILHNSITVCENKVNGMRDNRKPFAYGVPFNDGLKIIKANCKWIESVSFTNGCAMYNNYLRCCACGRRGAFVHEYFSDNARLYVPICPRCSNFIWPQGHKSKRYAKIYYNPIETNRRKF